MRAAVGHEPNGIAALRIKVGRFEHAPFQHEAVGRLDLHSLFLAETVLLDRIHGIRVDHPRRRAVGAAQADLLGVRVVTVGVHEEIMLGAELHAMIAGG